ncbi:M23 family metallopeptidase [Xinfangfangia pollutisoli]|uniref:M23 family metallopeptidase n=1 Tax=Xinfangfangia pollutisoli TaxID=2865960 RepID=UPI001CD61536|nr:M23 family metallopeptidase [Xinfangfangia pollutisoli]
MLARLAFRINTQLERVFPEQRLFLKSDYGTHFLRLRPATQALISVITGLGLAWTIVATAILMMETIGAGSARDQSLRQSQVFERRLGELSADRDLRLQEATQAQERFSEALEQVSEMQEMLLASEDRRRELETGIEVIQNTLRRTIKERDEARAEIARLTLALDQHGEGTATEMGRVHDTAATLEFLTGALADTARERDAGAAETAAVRDEMLALQDAIRADKARNDAIFAKLEEAVTVSMEPLDKMFRSVGLDPDDLIASVRKGYSGQGGPLSPITVSTSGVPLSAEEQRANAILKELDEMNLYRMAAFKVPLGMPVKSAVRFTSGFGGRNDPLGRGYRQHEGQDLAGDYGTAIYATADGVVTYAGWENGYGRLIKVKHAFGIETRYAHLSQIRVEVGQRVSRGDKIGDMGNSGRSTGTHLHYEVRLGGSAVNPLKFIKAASNVF